MNKSPLSRRSIILSITLTAIILLVFFLKDSLNNKTKIVFCDVGQGDAAYIRTKEKIDILIDAGPSRKILNCLGRHMPFYDRRIELALLSHPQKDHFGGYLYLLDRYTVGKFITSGADNTTQSFTLLKQKLSDKNIVVKNIYRGDRISLANTEIDFLWPEKKLVTNDPDNLNRFSQVFLFKEVNFKALFTGDIDNYFTLDRPIKVNILKVPHHGSKNGLTQQFLKLADPALSVISVGKNNPYGHPSKEILDMFKALKKRYLRTDQQGDIVIEIDGGGGRVK